MKNDYTSGKFKELLNKLQQESWQLELLISGFAIFGLITALTPIYNGLSEAKALENDYTIPIYLIAYASCYVLIINLIIHVILRGIWIGAIGLRYVSNDIEYEELKYSKRFTDYLKKKVGSFDKYIATLENYCSILFALTFLSVFYIVSLFNIVLIIIFAGKLFLVSEIFSELTGTFLLGIFGIIYFFFTFFIFLDFITQGLLKKKEWTSFLYMPIYKFFSIITLSFLYRPLVYNFLDNKFGRRISLILVPLYCLVFYLSTLNNVRSNYLSKSKNSSVNYSSHNNYFNLLEKNGYVRNAAIQSKIITDPFVKIFIPFKEKTEDFLLTQNKQLKPQKDNRGLRSNFFSNNNTKEIQKKKDSTNILYLNAFNKMYFVKIDSISFDSDFIITEINKQLGFETILPLKNISAGKHALKITRQIIVEKKEKLDKVAEIPFWHYKD